MNKRMVHLKKWAVIASILGLVMLGIVVLTGTAYPDPLFRILTPIGIGLVFIAAALYGIAWLIDIYYYVKKKEYVLAGGNFIIGLLIIISVLRRFI